MANLRNSTLFILLFWLSTSCALLNSKKFSLDSYPSTTGGDTLQVITISSDRIQQECIFYNAEAENNWRHQYMMYILDSEDEVIPIMHSLNQNKIDCTNQIRTIKSIYQKSKQVKLCLRGDIKKPHPYPEKINFGKLGQHTTKYEALWLQAVCNEKICYSYDGYTNTCPGFQISYDK